MIYRTALGVVAVMAAALVVVGLTFSVSTDGPADFRFVNGTEPKSLDPHVMTGQPEGRIAEAIFEGLTYRDSRSLRPVPGAAESWEISEDQTVYTFRMRPGAAWSDGRPLTAHDFAWSWRRLQEPAVAAEYAYILHMVRGAEVYNTYEGNANALEGTISEALARLRQENSGGVSAADWQSFLAKEHVSDHLKGVPDAVLVQALSVQEGRIDDASLGRIAEAVRSEATRRRERHVWAAAHFGVDSGVFARDDRTLVVELTAPTPYFLDITAFYPAFPVPRHVVEGRERDWFLPDRIVSNGPFLLQHWKVNEKIRLVRNPGYWGAGDVHLGSVDAYSVENVTTALNLYLTGAVDWLPSNYPQDLVDALKKRSDFYSNPGMVVYYYRLNTRRKPLDDPRVRQALALAVERNVIVENVLGLGQIPATRFVPPGLAGYEPPGSLIDGDIARARRLLAEAGFPDGKGFPKLSILFNTQETHRKIAEVVADQFRRNLGIDVEAHNQEWQAYQDSTRLLKYDIARAAWIGDYLDPNTFLDMWVTNGGNNQTGWGHPVYDRLIQAAGNVQAFVADPEPLVTEMKEPDLARERIRAVLSASGQAERIEASGRLRMHLFREAEAILVQDEFPVVPIYFYVVSGLVAPHVRGFCADLVDERGRRSADLLDAGGRRSANLQDIHPLRGMRIERGPAAGVR